MKHVKRLCVGLLYVTVFTAVNCGFLALMFGPLFLAGIYHKPAYCWIYVLYTLPIAYAVGYKELRP